MQKTDFHDAVDQVVAQDVRYSTDAYYFLQEVLSQAVEKQRKDTGGETRHVSGGDLLEVFRERMLNQFGPMSTTVLEEWGISRCEDVGDIVFNLIEAGAFGKSERDQREDFMEGYDFKEAFVVPFLPQRKWASDEGDDCRDLSVYK